MIGKVKPGQHQVKFVCSFILHPFQQYFTYVGRSFLAIFPVVRISTRHLSSEPNYRSISQGSNPCQTGYWIRELNLTIDAFIKLILCTMLEHTFIVQMPTCFNFFMSATFWFKQRSKWEKQYIKHRIILVIHILIGICYDLWHSELNIFNIYFIYYNAMCTNIKINSKYW